MIHPDKLFGRLGNRMFQMAYLMTEAKRLNSDLYFQDPKYFKEADSDIKLLFGLEIEPIEKVSIHVRRGDYVGNDFYVDLSETDYYEKAMNMFPDKTFLLFSDDIEWCKEHFKDVEFCEEEDEVKALNLMAGCEHNIIANSSFSWWAGYLNPNPNKKVVAPKAWYRDGVERTVCPKEWIRI